jgi:hypothetical protein
MEVHRQISQNIIILLVLWFLSVLIPQSNGDIDDAVCHRIKAGCSNAKTDDAE